MDIKFWRKPSQAKNEYHQKLGESTSDALRILHATYADDINAKMLAIFGRPDHCLVCSKPLDWGNSRIPSDIDPWFCNGHCPICMAAEHDNGDY
jgi:hypothetical protein